MVEIPQTQIPMSLAIAFSGAIFKLLLWPLRRLATEWSAVAKWLRIGCQIAVGLFGDLKHVRRNRFDIQRRLSDILAAPRLSEFSLSYGLVGLVLLVGVPYWGMQLLAVGIATFDEMSLDRRLVFVMLGVMSVFLLATLGIQGLHRVYAQVWRYADRIASRCFEQLLPADDNTVSIVTHYWVFISFAIAAAFHDVLSFTGWSVHWIGKALHELSKRLAQFGKRKLGPQSATFGGRGLKHLWNVPAPFCTTDRTAFLTFFPRPETAALSA